jgi:acylphosphatase
MREDRRTVHVIITGRVQGVYYRGWTAEMAERFGLDGWVRNRRDGSVEALFAGPGEAVASMLEACRKGPTAARVEEVAIIQEGGASPPGFEVLPAV